MAERQKLVSFRRLAKLLLMTVLALYVVVCLIIAVFQRSLLYFPRKASASQVSSEAQAAGLERWTNSRGDAIGFKRLSPVQPSQGTVFMAYGNGSTAVGSAHYADDIQKIAAFDVFVLEYPGYQDRPGSPTQSSLFHAADEALETLPANRPIYLFGESLGSGVACYLAGTHPGRIAGIILLSPYNRLTSVAQNHYPYLPVGLLMVDRFPSEDYLRRYHGKVGIVVDGQDSIVPEKFGRRLFDGYAGPKKLWAYPNGGHCQIMEPQVEFWLEAFEFLEN
jgi:uncharacterized protein